MLTGLKLSFLERKYVLYRPEHNEGLEIQKWNKLTERAQIVDEEIGAFASLSCSLQEL